ncbi:MAG: hypothetical protein KGI37_08795 [Alphaproteobacteria bacterium]|nr:hypothetical protein [Alphaproteobacteria bacterium]
MKIRATILTLSAVMGLTSYPLACARADTQAIRNADNEIWGSAGASFLNYKEEIPSPYLPDSEHATLPSAAIGITMLGYPGQGLASNLYLSIEGTGTFGDANYNGAYLQTPTTPLHATTTEHIWTLDSKIGKAFPLGPAAMLIPYADIGYRYWSRNLGSGYIEDYQNGELLGGLMLQIAPTSRLVLTGYGAAGTTFSPQMATGGETYNLGSAGAYKLGGKIGYSLTQRVELFTTLDYDAFRYGISGADPYGYYEPTSHTEDTAWRVGIGYHFN